MSRRVTTCVAAALAAVALVVSGARVHAGAWPVPAAGESASGNPELVFSGDVMFARRYLDPAADAATGGVELAGGVLGWRGHAARAVTARGARRGLGENAAWDDVAGSCTSYCHGASLAGGTNPTPRWATGEAGQATCGSCHGVPPPAPHPTGTDCASCHPTMEEGSMTFRDPTRHIDGVVDVIVGVGGCTSCHGSATSSAPPTDLDGNTARTFAGVGAHQAHLAASDWRHEITCSNCHVVPTDIDSPGHRDGDNVAEVPFDALTPDVVIIATGGLPQNPPIEAGGDLMVNAWDVVGGDARLTGDVVLYDDDGTHSAMTTAEMLARSGARVEIVTPERTMGVDVGGLNLVPYARAFNETDTRVTLNQRVRSISRDQSGRLRVQIGSDHSPVRHDRLVDAVVGDHGVLANDELYHELVHASTNLGELDHRAFIDGGPQTICTNPDGRYQLFRIGDAVAGRNIHAAVYDALRLCKDL